MICRDTTGVSKHPTPKGIRGERTDAFSLSCRRARTSCSPRRAQLAGESALEVRSDLADLRLWARNLPATWNTVVTSPVKDHDAGDSADGMSQRKKVYLGRGTGCPPPTCAGNPTKNALRPECD